MTINFFSIPVFLSSLLLFLFGFFLLIKNFQSDLNRNFALLTFATGVWFFSYTFMYNAEDPQNAFLFARIGYLGIIFIPTFLYGFTVAFAKISRYEKWLQLTVLIGLFFAVCDLFKLLITDVYKYYWGYYPKGSPLLLLFIAYFCIVFLVSLLIFYNQYKAKSLDSNKAKYLLLAFSLAILGCIDYFGNFGLEIYPAGYIFATSCIAVVFYAILRHRLMDIEVVIKKGIVYSILMAVIIGIYSFLIFVGQNIFQATLGINQWVAAVLTAFAIALGYKPLETFVTDLTSQYFFRKKYDYQKTLMQSSEAMNLLTDIDRLVRLITRIVARRMNLEEASTLVHDELHNRYIVKAAEGKSKSLLGNTFSNNHELFEHLFETRRILLKDEVKHTLENKMLLSEERKRLNAIRKEMEIFRAQVCVPSISRSKYMGNKLVAVFCMGEKKSGDMYTDEDIQLLSTLSNQAAIAVENALMYSDLMKQYQELKETKDQLVQSEKLAALGTMAAGIAHEIRNPLTSLQLFVQMMAERFDDHEFREKFTQVVPPEIERLNRIVNDLVSFAKPSKLTREPAQINEILDKTVRLSEISFKKLNVKVVKEFSEVPKVLVDSQQIMQIFLNLIMNGAQAMANGGTLTVKTYYDDIAKVVCVDVKDTGIGISEANLKKLFSPFFSTKEGGTGLGLAITRRIIEEHNGKIKVKSAIGEGTTFTVELPVAS